MTSQFVVAPITSSVVQMRSVRPIANASVSKSLVGSFGNSFSHANASNRRGAFMSTEAYDDSESPAESEESPAETNGGEVKLYIGNLSWDMDEQSLQDLFVQYEATDRVIVTSKHREISRVWICHGAVAELADSAIAALNESEQFGRQMSRRFYRRKKDRRENSDREEIGTRMGERCTLVTCRGGWIIWTCKTCVLSLATWTSRD